MKNRQVTKIDLRSAIDDWPGAELEQLLHDWEVWAREDQLPPADHDEDKQSWRTWLILGGRGAGKTRAGAEWVRAQALGKPPFAERPAKRIALVGETIHDVRSVMVEGVSGLLAIHPEAERPTYEPSKGQLVRRCMPLARRIGRHGITDGAILSQMGWGCR